MADHKISLVFQNDFSYPEKRESFRPSKWYPEYCWEKDDVAKSNNRVYDSVRESFHLQGWDAIHYGTSDWNPLGEFIKPGDQVLIKPNFVMDINRSGDGTDCLYTNPSVVAPVIDYAVIAMRGKGSIIIGDAPMQECDFSNLLWESGYDILADFYQKKGIPLEIVDFRELTSVVEGGVHKQMISDRSTTGTIIDLGSDSLHAGNDSAKNFRVTNYDPRILNSHHTKIKHEYYVSNILLKADVVINMPKPKTHRKAGITASLKNFVGINVRKEYLPHHTKGSVDEGGDEYPTKDLIHSIRSGIYDRRNIAAFEGKYKEAKILSQLSRAASLLLRIKRNIYSEGSWYGNNTISKTILDINKIVMYANKNGIICDSPQRKIIIVGDMIVSGENEGPVCPSPKNVGMIMTGEDMFSYDLAVAKIMGFDYKKIPTLALAEMVYGYNPQKYRIIIASNDPRYNGQDVDELNRELLLNFKPASGWTDHIELEK